MIVVRTDYSMESMSEILKGADALHLNYAMVPDEAEIEEKIVDAALEAKVKHIIYASTVSCDTETMVFLIGLPHSRRKSTFTSVPKLQTPTSHTT